MLIMAKKTSAAVEIRRNSQQCLTNDNLFTFSDISPYRLSVYFTQLSAITH
jgi:hypothetical protein